MFHRSAESLSLAKTLGFILGNEKIITVMFYIRPLLSIVLLLHEQSLWSPTSRNEVANQKKDVRELFFEIRMAPSFLGVPPVSGLVVLQSGTNTEKGSIV